MALRNSTRFIALTAASTIILFSLALHAAFSGKSSNSAINRRLARELNLTDLCLFTEARYTRHPSLADRHAPFQEHPAALEHFPSGSLLQPSSNVIYGTRNAEH